MESHKEKVYKSIKYSIIVKNLKSGEILNERELMNYYNIGRTPLREIFIELVREGLVQKFPRSGTIVAPMDYNKLKETCEVRKPLERLAGELAAERMNLEQLKIFHSIVLTLEKSSKKGNQEYLIGLDTDMHNLIYDSTGNNTLKTMLHQLHSFTLRYWFEPSTINIMTHIDPEQWLNIYESIKKKDSAAAGQLLVEHLDKSLNILKNNL